MNSNIKAVGNETAKRVHRAICDSGDVMAKPNADGSISSEETLGLIYGGVWGVAAFMAQCVVIAPIGEAKDKMTPEEVMAYQIAEQFIQSYRLYKAAAESAAN